MKEVRFKVCGMTRVEDTRVAAAAGASYLGFIFYPKSPRAMTLERFVEIRDELPDLPKVAVLVNPEPSFLERCFDVGLSIAQIHFDQDVDCSIVKQWSGIATPERLWLAPKIKPGDSFDESLLAYAGTILWDAYKKNAFGGTGHLSDWERFSKLRASHLEISWILAGGLNPDNLRDALLGTGAELLDFNSGVEMSPGVKNHDKIMAIGEELRCFSGK